MIKLQKSKYFYFDDIVINVKELAQKIKIFYAKKNCFIPKFTKKSVTILRNQRSSLFLLYFLSLHQDYLVLN
jgi:hypothetical protein